MGSNGTGKIRVRQENDPVDTTPRGLRYKARGWPALGPTPGTGRNVSSTPQGLCGTAQCWKPATQLELTESANLTRGRPAAGSRLVAPVGS